MLDRIRASLPSLAPAEQRVGRLVLTDPRAFANLPVSELSERAHVSKPTVVRFCRSMGYDGLSDFKLKLAGSVSEGVPIAETYKTGRRIEFFGSGNSGVVALDAQHKFFRLGVHTIAYSDGHMQVMSATLLGPGDCIVMISNSGRTRDLMDACDIARKNGVTTIVITVSGSPLAAAGQIHLAADHPEGYDRYSPMVSRLLHLMIIDILATCVALRIGGERLQPMLQALKNNLRSKRYA